MRRSIPFHSNAVWPPPLWVAVFFFCYGVVALTFWLIDLAVPAAGMQDSGQNVGMREAILVCAAVLYAAFRLWRFHPACNHAYAAWLKLSPWTAAKPLPLGPVHLVWQDAVVIGVLAAMAYWHAHLDPMLPVVIFGLIYLVGFTLLLAFTRRKWHCLALGFLWPALVLPGVAGAPRVGLLILAAIIAVIWHGYRQSLKAFPWEFISTRQGLVASFLQTKVSLGTASSASASGAQYDLGWPYLALSPKMRPPSVSNSANLAVSALVGWWFFCAIEASQMEPAPELILVFAFVAALFRVVIYCSGVTAPFNVWGRISSGRIIVPGFDKVFLTPLAAILVAIPGVIMVKWSGDLYPVAEACVLALVWYVLFGGGPTLRNWALTGQHRLRPPNRANATKQLLRPV